MSGLRQQERDAIDLALTDVYRAVWESGDEPKHEQMRAAYMQGRVDRSLERPLALGVSTHTRKES